MWKSHSRRIAILALLCPLGGCVNADYEYATQWYRLRPPPTDEQIAQFQARFPTTAVTTTQPGTWDKLEPGMTRAMVRALVGNRLTRQTRRVARLDQDDVPIMDECRVKLFFDSVGRNEDDDVLLAIIIRRIVNRLPRPTEFP